MDIGFQPYHEFNKHVRVSAKRSKEIKENLFLFLSGLNGKCEQILASRWYVGHNLGVPAITYTYTTKHSKLGWELNDHFLSSGEDYEIIDCVCVCVCVCVLAMYSAICWSTYT